MVVRAYMLLAVVWVLLVGDDDDSHLGIRQVLIFAKRVDHGYLQSPDNCREMN